MFCFLKVSSSQNWMVRYEAHSTLFIFIHQMPFGPRTIRYEKLSLGLVVNVFHVFKTLTCTYQVVLYGFTSSRKAKDETLSKGEERDICCE
ncbi:unnamed protein product [Arabidopsis halleri]